MGSLKLVSSIVSPQVRSVLLSGTFLHSASLKTYASILQSLVASSLSTTTKSDAKPRMTRSLRSKHSKYHVPSFYFEHVMSLKMDTYPQSICRGDSLSYWMLYKFHLHLQHSHISNDSHPCYSDCC